MRKLMLAIPLAVSIASAQAAELPAPARAEIDGLLSMLGASQCQFYRNGSWHDGREAESHLRMKFEYLLGHGRLHSADDFIDGAATRSSLSGEPYAVKCSNEGPQPSAAWLKARLQERRKS